MKLWLDAQLSPGIAEWLSATFELNAIAVRDLGLRDSEDEEIFRAAREEHAIVMTKDADFVTLLERHGPPPQILWITCGNTSDARLREILLGLLGEALRLLEGGEELVEISQRSDGSTR